VTDAAGAALSALRALCAATVEPPATDADPEEILTRGRQVVASREQPLQDLAAALERDPKALHGAADAGALYASIQERAAGWQAALARARHLVGERTQAFSRLRGRRQP